MSRSKNRYQAERWLKTAEEDLAAARVLAEAGMYAQACFYAQQSGEKAVKALWYLVDESPWGHSIQRLLLDLSRLVELAGIEEWLRWGMLLDKFYIPTRYPNGLPDLTPGQVYGPDDARQGLEAAQSLVAACREWLEYCV